MARLAAEKLHRPRDLLHQSISRVPSGTMRLWKRKRRHELAQVIVSFDPGARTNWDIHPLGQTLHVTAGSGFIQKEGEPIQPINTGDSIWIAPGEALARGKFRDRHDSYCHS
ncbi:quercetin dioxygenase-like cupin family protein [Pseudorhizobium tarimense]|uniref:Quercetin dioxygenase-like cupin family protein n=1 Tax=Pseudorhizobium tarimense TaxID=1079109 RepID=A0ABV2HDA8_9HYPH